MDRLNVSLNMWSLMRNGFFSEWKLHGYKEIFKRNYIRCATNYDDKCTRASAFYSNENSINICRAAIWKIHLKTVFVQWIVKFRTICSNDKFSFSFDDLKCFGFLIFIFIEFIKMRWCAIVWEGKKKLSASLKLIHKNA